MKNKKIGLLTSSLVLGGMFAASNALAQNNIVNADSVAKDSTKTSVVSSSTATEKSNTVVLKASKANKDVNSSSAKASSASQSSQASVKSSSVASSQAKLSSAATSSVKTAENSSSSTAALKADQNLNLAKTNAASSSKTAKASSTQQAQPVMLAAKQTKDVKQVKAYDHQYHIFFNDVNNTNADGTFKGVTPQYGSDNGYTVLSFEDSHNQNIRYGVEWQTSVETKASTYKIYAPKGYHFDINYTKWFDNSKAPYFHFEGQDVVVFDWQKYANAQQNPNGNKSFELFLYKDGQKPAAIPTAKGYYIHWVPSKGYSNQVSSHPYKNYTFIPVNDMHQTGKSQYKYQVWAPAGTSFDLSQGSVYGNWEYAPIHTINDHTGYVYPDNVPTKDYVGNGQATMVAWVNKDNSWKGNNPSWKAISSQAKKASSSTANHTDNKKPANNSSKKPAANTNHNNNKKPANNGSKKPAANTNHSSNKKPATNNVKKPAAPKKNTASKTTVKKTSTKKVVTSKKSSTKKAVASSSAKASVKSVKAAAPVATTVKASTVSNSNAAKATTEVVTSSVKASVAQPSVEKTVATTVTPSKAQASSSNKGLPQMGETNNHSTIGGLVALAASSILGLFGLGLRKKNN